MSLREPDIQRLVQRSLTDIEPAERGHLPVTWYRHEDGAYQVLNHYGDDVWEYPTTRFPSATPNNERTIRFSSLPAPFRGVMKDVMRDYDRTERPAGSTLVQFFFRIRPFLHYLVECNLTDLADLTPMHCANYVKQCRDLPGLKSEMFSAGALYLRLVTVEKLRSLLVGTPHAFPHPWPESSAAHLSGRDPPGSGPYRAKTPIIPDDELRPLFTRAVQHIAEAAQLLALRDELEILRAEQQKARSTMLRRLVRHLQQAGYDGTLGDFNAELDDLQCACIVVILTLSGIRVHELCYLRNDAWYETTDEDGHSLFWMKSRSDKTGEGDTQWLVPELVTQALNVVQHLAQPLQALWMEQREALLDRNPRSRTAYRMAQHEGALFLGVEYKHNGRVSGLCARTIVTKINCYAAKCGVNMRLTPHQFRRTFATYVAKSAYGDLRYLRKHFKHWSLDMTTLYALNEAQDAELYDEIMTAVIDKKVELVTHWLDEDTLLSGGSATTIRAFRNKGDAVRTYEDRRRMALSIADTIFIRSTGTAWCTADDGGCAGRGVIENTRCAQCDGSVIDDHHTRRWTGIYAQTLELREIEDVGPAGRERIERDIRRCEQVLSDLGVLDACRTPAALEEQAP